MKGNRKLVVLGVVFAVVAVGAILIPALLQRTSVAATKPATSAVDREELARLAAAEPMSKLFRGVALAMKPAVVEVRVKKRVAAPRLDGMDPEDFLRRFFGDEAPVTPRRTPRQPQPDQERFQIQRGLGSGVIVDAQNGYILTNYHVVGGADEVEIIMHDDRRVTAEKVWHDPPSDLSVVKIKPDGLNLVAAPLGDSGQMEVGDLVLAFGAPEGLAQTVTMGIISAKGRTTGTRNYEDFIQTDAAINHGNSGGPLVNMRGEVIGINAAIISRTGVNEGIGFAVSSNLAKVVLDQLVKSGKVTRGFLGVSIQDVDEKLVKSFNLPSAKGALVTKISPDSPAAKTGLKQGDFITAVGEKSVSDVNSMRNEVANYAPGTKVKLTFYRDGKKETADVTVAAQPADMYGKGPTTSESGGPPTGQQYGLTMGDLTANLAEQLGYESGTRGVVIKKVDDDSDAAEEGLKAGMVVDQVNGKKVASLADWNAALKEAKGDLRLRVLMPDGGVQYVVVSPGK